MWAGVRSPLLPQLPQIVRRNTALWGAENLIITFGGKRGVAVRARIAQTMKGDDVVVLHTVRIHGYRLENNN
jgi:hypothetical protein